MTYKVKLKPKAAKFVLSQPKNIQRQIFKQLKKLQQNPTPVSCRKLDEPLQIYKLTFRQIRIVYQIRNDELIVSVLAMGEHIYTGDVFEEILKIIKKNC